MGMKMFGFDEFKKEIHRVKKKYPEELEKCLIRIALKGMAKVKRKSPVDTGQLRRNWSVTSIERIGDTFKVTLYNPIEYSLHVEYGHRTRGGKGFTEGYYMLTASLKELEKEMPREIQKMLRELS